MKYGQLLFRRTKIVCTLGPATASQSMIEKLLKAGMNVARLNLSYGTHDEHERTIGIVRETSQRLGLPAAVLMDLPGPKYRIGKLRGGSVNLKKGATVMLTSKEMEGNEKELPVNLPTLTKDIKSCDTVLLGDGALELKVEEVSGKEATCKVVVGGNLLSGKGVVVPGMTISTPFLTDTLRSHLAFAMAHQPDFVALSFVTTSAEVLHVRELLQRNDAGIPIISKIERVQAVDNFDEILLASDGIMVARGDLGVALPLEKVPMVQKDIIRKCNKAGKPVITATQMLESMIKAPLPTRAEVTDVANAIFDGTDAAMLSGETAMGEYPVQAVQMMARIAVEAEAHLPYDELLVSKRKSLEPETDEAISYDACRTALQLGAAAIVAFTQSGSTAKRVSKYRPRVPVLALTPDEKVRRRLLLYWGVYPVKIVEPYTIGELFKLGADLAVKTGLAKKGELIVITGGIPVGVAGGTNMLKVERIG